MVNGLPGQSEGSSVVADRGSACDGYCVQVDAATVVHGGEEAAGGSRKGSSGYAIAWVGQGIVFIGIFINVLEERIGTGFGN